MNDAAGPLDAGVTALQDACDAPGLREGRERTCSDHGFVRALLRLR